MRLILAILLLILWLPINGWAQILNSFTRCLVASGGPAIAALPDSVHGKHRVWTSFPEVKQALRMWRNKVQVLYYGLQTPTKYD